MTHFIADLPVIFRGRAREGETPPRQHSTLRDSSWSNRQESQAERDLQQPFAWTEEFLAVFSTPLLSQDRMH